MKTTLTLSCAVIFICFPTGESLICFTCVEPDGSQFSDSFDKCQNIFTAEKSYYPFNDNPKCYNGAFCAKFIFPVFENKVTIRTCISRSAIVDFDPENPPSPTQSIQTNFRGYRAEGYFCKNDYCNGAVNKNLAVIAFILTIILQFI